MTTWAIALLALCLGICLPFLWFWLTASWDERRRKPQR